jgi:hypothetical protein
MKLLFCKSCNDIVKLIETKRTCKCGKVGGKYTDDLNAVYFGEMAVPIGFANSTLVKAINNQPQNGIGENFTSFVIPRDCSTYKLVLEQDF